MAHGIPCGPIIGDIDVCLQVAPNGASGAPITHSLAVERQAQSRIPECPVGTRPIGVRGAPPSLAVRLLGFRRADEEAHGVRSP